jgi:hypothetical protein
MLLQGVRASIWGEIDLTDGVASVLIRFAIGWSKQLTRQLP